MLGLRVGELRGMAETIKGIEASTRDKVRLLLIEVGDLTVRYLQSYLTTSGGPPDYKSPPRPPHPGHWRDISTTLRDSYYSRVQMRGGWPVLEIGNTAPYAAALEARIGYFVLTGVTDPGGPVERAMRQAVRVVAPDWIIRSYD